MLKKIFSVTASLFAFFCATAQTDSTKKSSTTFSGFVDAYYRSNFSAGPGTTNNLTSFTNSQNSFELGMASMKVEHTTGKVSGTVDLGFGMRAHEFSYNDSSRGLSAIKQAYVSFAASDKVKFTMGKWATHIGYEVVDPTGNRNYSMAYAFSYGPFFHTGFKADISLGGKSAFMIGVANPTDFTTTTSNVKVLIAQFSTATKNDKLKAFVNYQGGTGLSQFDLVVNGIVSDKFSVGYNGTSQSLKTNGLAESWTSHIVYLNLDPSAGFGMTLRGEYFKDRATNPILGNAANIFAATLSGNIKIDGHLTIIPEFRLDNAKNSIFTKSDGGFAKGTNTFLLAAVYKF
ncbi:MAG: porin [Sphingobacteriia bacterium]|nr:MAG: porin [Sphingobacteriia bacterium]TAG30931.1 MAG: porin [Sphingobacteriia bacterium]TAH08791.1 MAG: porin [Sphingobacteriia bacterium]